MLLVLMLLAFIAKLYPLAIVFFILYCIGDN